MRENIKPCKYIKKKVAEFTLNNLLLYMLIGRLARDQDVTCTAEAHDHYIAPTLFFNHKTSMANLSYLLSLSCSSLIPFAKSR